MQNQTYSNDVSDKVSYMFRKMLESSTNPVFLIGLDGSFQFTNSASLKLTGYCTEELQGRSFALMFDGNSFSYAEEQFTKSITQCAEISSFETEIVCKSGNKRFVAISLSPIIEARKITCILCHVDDITKQKYAEKQVRQQEIEHVALSTISRVAIQAESEEVIYDKIPQFIGNLFGFEFVSIELYNQDTDELIFKGNIGIDLPDGSPVNEKLAGTVSGDVIRSGKPMIITDLPNHPYYNFDLIKGQNNKIFVCLPMKAKKKTTGTLCLASNRKEYVHHSLKIILQTVADIIAQAIESKRAEKSLKEYQQHLEELVKKRTKELQDTQEKLIHTAKLSAIGKLSASIAHEFNNPICGIRNVLERVSERINSGSGLDETHKDLTTLAIKECNRMADLVKKLLDFYRPSSGIVASIDIHVITDEILLINKKRWSEKNITLHKHYDYSIPAIEAVQDQIKQVILNIMQNAEDVVPRKGAEIAIVTERVEPNIKIHIKDNGKGIKPEHINTIFDPFFSTKPAVKGTGLGLSISHGIIKKHGGDIDVTSEVGKGTTFTITLPINVARTQTVSTVSNQRKIANNNC